MVFSSYMFWSFPMSLSLSLVPGEVAGWEEGSLVVRILWIARHSSRHPPWQMQIPPGPTVIVRVPPSLRDVTVLKCLCIKQSHLHIIHSGIAEGPLWVAETLLGNWRWSSKHLLWVPALHSHKRNLMQMLLYQYSTGNESTVSFWFKWRKIQMGPRVTLDSE